MKQIRDGSHCRTWNLRGGVGSRSNSSHLTYIYKPTQPRPLNPKPHPNPTHLHPLDLDATPPCGSHVLHWGATDRLYSWAKLITYCLYIYICVCVCVYKHKRLHSKTNPKRLNNSVFIFSILLFNLYFTCNWQCVLMLKGGNIGIFIDWSCNLDYPERFCIPKYSFSRLDNKNPENNVAPGYNFRYI